MGCHLTPLEPSYVSVLSLAVGTGSPPLNMPPGSSLPKAAEGKDISCVVSQSFSGLTLDRCLSLSLLLRGSSEDPLVLPCRLNGGRNAVSPVTGDLSPVLKEEWV